MADKTQFGMQQFGSAGPVRSAVGAGCAQCEAMLSDLLDGNLSPQELAAFEVHRAACTPCDQMLADARRGAEMLSMLRLDRPQPAADLFDRILAATSGTASHIADLSTSAITASSTTATASTASTALPNTAVTAVTAAIPAIRASAQPFAVSIATGIPASHPASPLQAAEATIPQVNVQAIPQASQQPASEAHGRLLAFPYPTTHRSGLISHGEGTASRIAASLRRVTLTMVQPRLAMTAAMAFFSIALTLNLTGVRLSALKASDLRPAAIQRSFYQANAHVVRYYENLRVVYELESRVRDLQRANDLNSDSNPNSSPNSNPDSNSGSSPNITPDSHSGTTNPTSTPDGTSSKPQPGPSNRSVTRQGSGTSQRQSLIQPRYRLARYERFKTLQEGAPA